MLFNKKKILLIRFILLELFYALTAGLVIFLILEIIWPGVVLAYLNLNFILLLWLINASIVLMIKK